MTDCPALRTRILAAISSVPCDRCRQRPDYKPSDCEKHTCRQMYEQEADAVMDILLQTPHTGDKPMTDHTDRSTEALLARRTLAEKATLGPCKISSDGLHIIGNINGRYLSKVAQATVITNAAHIVSNEPQVVMADIDEILRLRAEVTRLKRALNDAALEDWLTTVETAVRGDIAGDPEVTKRLDELGPAAVILRLVEMVRHLTKQRKIKE